VPSHKALAQDTPPHIALFDVLKHTYLHNPKLRAQRAELRATNEQLPQAMSGYKPTIAINADIQDTHISGSPSVENSNQKKAGATIRQPVFRGGRTVAQAKEAKHNIAFTLHSLYESEQQILLNASIAYLNVVRDQSLLELSIGNLNFITKQHEAAQNRFDVGELSNTDVSQSRARLSNAEADIITARGNLRSSRAIFEEITGMAAHHLKYPDAIAYKFPETLEETIDLALTKNPQISAAKSLYSASQEGSERIWGELLPEVHLTGGWTQQFESQHDDIVTRMVGLNATMPLYSGGATRSRIRAAKETSNQRYLQILDSINHVKQATITAWATLKAAKAEIEARQAQVVATKLAREGVTAEARFGDRSVLDVLDADQEYLDAQTSLVTSQRNALVATLSLMKQLGDIRPHILGFPELAINYKKEHDEISDKIFDIGVTPIK